MKTGAVIIAGGKSARMGQEKALLGLAGKPVVQWIIDRIEPQTGPLAINANGDAERFYAFGRQVIPDEVTVGTPLSGLHAALRWAQVLGLDAVITVPSDSPFLPHDLMLHLEGLTASVAASGGHTHYLTGFWPTNLLGLLEETLCQPRHASDSRHPASVFQKESGTPAFAGVTDDKEATERARVIRVQDWVRLSGARVVEWPDRPYDPFFNINTPHDLAEAERIAAEFAP